MRVAHSTETDRKDRWGGWLENPCISKFQRSCLDGLRVKKSAEFLKALNIYDVLEVCCGLGEYSGMKKWRYVGLDNSLPHLSYAVKNSPGHWFVTGDAYHLPFKDKSFTAVLLACASHHFPDDGFRQVLTEMQRVSRKYLIIDDAIRWQEQHSLSKFFYGLDRGAQFRNLPQMENFLSTLAGWKILSKTTHLTFPGLYCHGVFILESASGT